MIVRSLITMAATVLTVGIPRPAVAQRAFTSDCWIERLHAPQAGGDRVQIARVRAGAVCSVSFPGRIRSLRIESAGPGVKADIVNRAVVFRAATPGRHTVTYVLGYGPATNTVRVEIDAHR